MARHRRVLTTTRMWLKDHEHAQTLPAIANIVGFCIWRCYFDAMRTMDLGVYQIIVCSALVEFCAASAGIFAGALLLLRLRSATAHYRQFCKRRRLEYRCRRITKAFVTGPRGPQPGDRDRSRKKEYADRALRSKWQLRSMQQRCAAAAAACSSVLSPSSPGSGPGPQPSPG